MEDKLENVDLNLFETLAALDKKDYGYYDRLTVEQKKKFSPFMMVHWMSAIKGGGDLQSYYLQSSNYHANKYILHETVSKHDKLQWLMLCASSPNMGKQFHQWIPHIKQKVSLLEEDAKAKDIKEYYKKIYPKASEDTIKDIADEYVRLQKRKRYLAEQFPDLKFQDIEVLNEIVSEEDIKKYEKEKGN